MINYEELDAQRVPIAATIALKRLCDGIDVMLPANKIKVSVSMSEDGVFSIQHARMQIDTETGEIEQPTLKLTPDGFSAYETIVLHRGEDGEDFIIARFGLQHGELDESGMGVFTGTSRYLSMKTIRGLSEPESLQKEIEAIIAELK